MQKKVQALKMQKCLVGQLIRDKQRSSRHLNPAQSFSKDYKHRKEQIDSTKMINVDGNKQLLQISKRQVDVITEQRVHSKIINIEMNK